MRWRKGLAGFSGGIMDPFDDIDPFNQVNCRDGDGGGGD